MNGFERYMAVLRGAPVDYLPRLPILMQYAAEYIGSNYGEFASDHRVLVEANLRCAEAFDFDQVSVISDPYRETAGFGAEIEFPRDSVPRCLAPPLAQTMDFSTLSVPDPAHSPRMCDRVDAIRDLAAAVAGQRSILGWIEGPAAEAADLRGVTQFLLDLLDAPSFAGALMDACIEVGIAFALAQLDAGADTIGVGDAICSQISPAVYAELILPRQMRLISAIHDAGGFVRLHICGSTTHLLPSVRALAVDIYDCDWQVDLKTARRELGEGTVLTGNLDPVKDVKDSTPERIRAAVEAAYRAAGNPYMVGAGCEIPSGTAPENLEALCAQLRC